MTSFIEVRNQLLISNDEGVWNDDELLLLYDLSRSNNLDLRHDFFPDFNFDDLEDDEYLSEFRLHQCDLPFLTELYDEVNELISKCLIRLARQICVPTGKHLSKPLILRLIMKTATRTQVFMVSTLLKVLEFHHNKLFDIWVLLDGKNFDWNACKLSLFTLSFQKDISRYSHVRPLAWVRFSFLDLSWTWNISHYKRKQAIIVPQN